ncbi:MAG: glycosyltransferase family 39 protein [Acidobacteriota bacterium]
MRALPDPGAATRQGTSGGKWGIIPSMHMAQDYPQARRLWLIGLLVILGVHVVWHSLNRMPPAWDMAYHQQMGWSYYEAARDGRLFSDFARLSDYYPPLYYLIEALIFGLLGVTHWLAFLANLPGLLLASYCGFRLAWAAVPSPRAALAGHLVLLFPLVAWTSRESLLDPTLTGLVALALFVALRSRSFQDRHWSWAFGVVAAAGLLLKWTFIVFIVPLTILTFVWSQDRRTSMRNRLEAFLIAAPLVFWWYLPNLVPLYRRFRLTTAGAEWEQDPAVWSWLGWIYYPRSLASWYLFLPLMLIFLWAVWRLVRSRPSPSRDVVVLMAVTLVGGLILLSLLKAKDPRYVMPLATPLAVLLVAGLSNRVAAGVGVLAFLQFLLISFSIPLVPQKIALFSIPSDTDYISMRQEWVLFESNYFGVTGPPRRQDWRYREILQAIDTTGQVGFVPDAVFFHLGALSLFSAEAGRPLKVIRLGLSDRWPQGLERVDWVVGKTGSQGISYITRFNSEVYGALESLKWPLVASWDLPDGSRAQLWRNPSRSQ